MESYQLPSRQVELPVVLVQDSMASFKSVDLEPIPESVLWASQTFGTEHSLQDFRAGYMTYTHSAIVNLYTIIQRGRRADSRTGRRKGVGCGKGVYVRCLGRLLEQIAKSRRRR